MDGIEEVTNFLMENHPFYVATVDSNAPRVRPFGFVMNYQGKLIFACNDQMRVYHQLMTNRNFEVSTINKNYQSIRLKGKAEFITDQGTKEEIIGLAPNIRNLSKDIDGIVIFYAAEAEATFWSMSGEMRSVEL